MDVTAAILKSLWLKKVDNRVSCRYRPIDVQIVREQDDAYNVAAYMMKQNPCTMCYELFDDWSTSRLNDSPPHEPLKIEPSEKKCARRLAK